ncbi:amidase [Palleronia sp. LCG004]|uniref:amidase n=1 Tax=Palleronia sp. LCG004 TaxID=3079304 RepID=UPI0029429EBF|nr:amidase [Palleronia sp. LCG004]WOI57584.1 amidase [Palleronia sp. LCG004]
MLDRTARETLADFAAKTISPVDYMDALIARVEASEPTVAALWSFAPERAMDEARASEARWVKGTPQGPLDGMPVTIKELIATRGEAVPMGTAATELVPAEEDAPTAARLREAGAICFAKTTSPDYGMLTSGLSSFHRLSRNPWDPAKNPGGSSAGASAAAAAGYGPLHIGTDIGGSIRLPAGLTGICGFKPSNGRVPISPYYTGRCAGPMTPTVDDSALLMATIARPDWRDAMALPYEALDYDAEADMSGLRIGLMLDAGVGLDPEPQVVAAVKRAAEAFVAAGAEIVEIPPVMTREMIDGLDIAWRARFWSQMEGFTPEKRELILPYIREWAEGAARASGTDVARGADQIFAMREATIRAFHGLDAILSPVNPANDYPADWASPVNDPARPFEHIGFTVPWNMGEQPAVSVNCGFSDSGMPIGLQIVGPRFHDVRVLGLARLWEGMREDPIGWPRIDGRPSAQT